MLSKKVTKLLSVCKSNFLALIILLPKTVKLNAIKVCILVDVVGVFALVMESFGHGLV